MTLPTAGHCDYLSHRAWLRFFQVVLVLSSFFFDIPLEGPYDGVFPWVRPCAASQVSPKGRVRRSKAQPRANDTHNFTRLDELSNRVRRSILRPTDERQKLRSFLTLFSTYTTSARFGRGVVFRSSFRDGFVGSRGAECATQLRRLEADSKGYATAPTHLPTAPTNRQATER